MLGKNITGEKYQIVKSELLRRKVFISGLKAGFVDDNEHYNRYIHYLRKYRHFVMHYPLKNYERITLKIIDRNKLPLFGAVISIYNNKRLLVSGYTHSNGTFLFFPGEHLKKFQTYQVEVRYFKYKQKILLKRSGPRLVNIKCNLNRIKIVRPSFDIIFIIDTTKSMITEIHRVTKMIRILYLQLKKIPGRPLFRFSIVLFKDRMDKNSIETLPFTANGKKINNFLDKAKAYGGGDYPENIAAPLGQMSTLQWNKGAVKLVFLLTDAPPHVEVNKAFDYRKALVYARKKGIKIHSIGLSGMTLASEYIMRQISHYTNGYYVFLTSGKYNKRLIKKKCLIRCAKAEDCKILLVENIIKNFILQEMAYILMDYKKNPIYFNVKRCLSVEDHMIFKDLYKKLFASLLESSKKYIHEKMRATFVPIETTFKKFTPIANRFSKELFETIKKSKRIKIITKKINTRNTITNLKVKKHTLDRGALKKMKLDFIISGKLIVKSKIVILQLVLIDTHNYEIVSQVASKLDYSFLKL